jgi:myo-inositol-1(or 4)-monophosphatase
VSNNVTINVASLCGLVIEVAKAEILPRFQQIKSHRKEDGSLVTEADLSVQRRLTECLGEAYPEIPLLGEEMSQPEQARILGDSSAGFWCLDPLDGTSNYVAGMPCFATSLAYIHQGKVRIGVIYDPLRAECFHAVRDEGAWLNGKRLQRLPPAKELKTCIAMVDFKRLSRRLASQLASKPPYRSQRSIGSVALDWCWLAAGRLQLYLHGGAKLWDYAAGSLIYREAGGYLRLTPGHVSQPEQCDLSLQPRMAIAAADEALFRSWLEWLSEYD